MLLEEIKAIGIRPDMTKPDVRIEKRATGGIFITDMVGMTQMEHDGIKDILREYRYHNCRVVIKEDISYDQFLDVLLKNTVYIPTLTVMNKIDMVDDEYIDELRNTLDFDFVPISADTDRNLEELKDIIFERLELKRIYMKPRGEKADMEEPMIVRKHSTIGDIARMVHGDLRKRLRYTRVWGNSVKFGGQKVKPDHIPADEDIITFYA
jgi:ribosome-interacting GTPase 1